MSKIDSLELTAGSVDDISPVGNREIAIELSDVTVDIEQLLHEVGPDEILETIDLDVIKEYLEEKSK